jgi:release factor glutamine methyltransferase
MEVLEPVDLVANPAYIPENRNSTGKHVKDFNRRLRFVSDEDPIIFYKAIGNFAIQKLKKKKKIFLEIHHDYAKDIVEWYEKNGFLVELKKDFSGNNRMIKAYRA